MMLKVLDAYRQYIQKTSNFLQKSFENLTKSLQNDSSNCSEIPEALQTRTETNFQLFFYLLEPPGPPKIEPKSQKSEKIHLKNDVEKEYASQHIFFSIFLCFGPRKWIQNRFFFALFSKTSIL